MLLASEPGHSESAVQPRVVDSERAIVLAIPAAGAMPAAVMSGRLLAALVIGQLGLHSAMAGLRMSAPLLALRDGRSEWAVGVLMALFALAPVLLALRAGRMADRHGYHRPVRLAVVLSMIGGTVALVATWLVGWPQFMLLCAAAALTGAGTNLGLIAILRTAGHWASDSTQRVRVFSWLGLAPSMSNAIGPVLAGLLIDAAGFRLAFVVLLALPLLSWHFASRVPPWRPELPPGHGVGTAWDLLDMPGLKRLMGVNLLLSACWDVHAFAVPVLGHERGFSASTIGLVLGSFTLSVTAVRVLIPVLAHHVREVTVLRAAMLGTGLVFAAYPFATNPWLMGLLAMALGVTLGCVQPMIMSGLHHLTPAPRHGEAIALRSMVINLSSTALPLVFGVAGAAVGVSTLFWSVGAATAAGSWPARHLRI
ncbi:MAG TPA: MFS transporter [Burkholderiaceae bacterium]|nr:MFS transporter [Burkholderiaceae bacterium]